MERSSAVPELSTGTVQAQLAADRLMQAVHHAPVSARSGLRGLSRGVTHVGTVRAVNEDAFLDRPDRGVWAVADGMGGHAAGDIASRTIIECLAELPDSGSLSSLVEVAEDRLLEANRRLLGIAIQQRQHTIGSTVAVLLARGRHVACMWAGDSRIYRLRGRRLEQLTQDHAVVEDLVASGELSRREAAQHPQANLITRAIGARPGLYVDIEIHEVRGGDTFLLCSDGLYKEVGDSEIRRLLAQGESGVSPALDLALARGARDNVTALAVQFV